MQALPGILSLAETAFFFDFDGTLVELAPTPDGVVVPRLVPDLLTTLRRVTNGAVAVVSGRGIDSIDSYLAMPDLPIAGLHGAERRDSNGDMQRIGFNDERLLRMEHVLEDVVSRNAGMLLEIKGAALALHYRNAPDREPVARAATERLVQEYADAYVLQPGKMVYEIKPKDVDKGRAVRAFMSEPPFAGRKPVFVGDDLTDEKGFAVVNEFGGAVDQGRRGRYDRACAHRVVSALLMLASTSRLRASMMPRRIAAASSARWESRCMSRLIIVSNRVAPISEGGPAAGGLAVGVYDALKETGGMWFGWSGDVLSAPPAGIQVEERGPVTFATIASRAPRLRPVLPRFFERDAVACVPLSRRPDPIRPPRVRRLLPREPLARREACAAAAARRRHLGSRLSPDSVRAGAARDRREEPGRLFPAHSVSRCADPAELCRAIANSPKRSVPSICSASRRRPTCARFAITSRRKADGSVGAMPESRLKSARSARR